ncbi:MAG: hypothetical protein Q4G33_01255 [bacterium]|nr:hypothetical protein [bacterium]
MKDKKFKAVNREENYAKNNAPDIQLGRHGDFAEKPQRFASRKMKTYQARQPTNDGAELTADISHSADTENFAFAPEQQEYGGYNSDAVNVDTVRQPDLQIIKSDIGFSKENADMQRQTSQRKNRTYQRCTQFSQKSDDYDFTKKNQSSDYSFTDTSEPYSPDTAEQAENAVDETTDAVQNHFENNAPKSEPPKRSHKKILPPS